MRSAWQQFTHSPLWIIIFISVASLSFLGWLLYHFFIQPPPILVLCTQPIEKLTLSAPLVLASPVLPPTPYPTYTPTPPSGLPTPIPRQPNGDWPPLGIFPPPKITETPVVTEQTEIETVKVSCPPGEKVLFGRFRGSWEENSGQLRLITICFALRPGKAVTFRGVIRNSLVTAFRPIMSDEEMQKQLQFLVVNCQEEEERTPLAVILPDESSNLGPFLVRVENVFP